MLNYFYCSNNNADQYPTSIVSTFLHQLLSRLPLGYNAIEKEYEHWAIRDIDRESVHFEELWSLFRAETTQYQKIYVIIDGLDEIDPTGRAQLLNAANNLLSECKTQYKILISSQIFPEISLLEKYEQWIIRPSDNEDDVRKLVHMRTEKNGQLAFLGRDISPDTKQYIRHALVQRACGM
ncbi:hypothetical protein VI817_007915 [Penicillium citrinum]|nr:hypothetical protein VI817_007915 [Penicillium citrinum]